MNYFYTASIWVLLFWLALTAINYSWLGALILALIGGISGAMVNIWWQEPHQFKPAKLRPMFTDEKGTRTRTTSYETIAMARQRQSKRSRRQEGLVSRLLRQRSR